MYFTGEGGPFLWGRGLCPATSVGHELKLYDFPHTSNGGSADGSSYGTIHDDDDDVFSRPCELVFINLFKFVWWISFQKLRGIYLNFVRTRASTHV